MAKEAKKKEIPVIKIKKCNSCIVCIDVCPVNCLAPSVVSKGQPGHRYPVLINEDACTGCGSCAEECPVDAVTMVPRAAA